MVPLASSPGHTLLPRLVAWDMGTGKTRNGNEETGNGKWEMGNEKQTRKHGSSEKNGTLLILCAFMWAWLVLSPSMVRAVSHGLALLATG